VNGALYDGDVCLSVCPSPTSPLDLHSPEGAAPSHRAKISSTMVMSHDISSGSMRMIHLVGCVTGGLRAPSTDGVLSAEYSGRHDRSLRDRAPNSICLPSTHSARRRTTRHLGNIGNGTITRIYARRPGCV